MSEGLVKHSPPRRGFSVVSFIIGVAVGGAIASGVLGFLLVDQQQRHAEALTAAALKMGFHGIDAAGNLIDAKIGTSNKKLTEEEKITEVGKSFVDDLEKNRLLKVHRSMTEECRTKNPLDMFTAYVDKFGTIRMLDPTYYREHYIRKLAKERGYEFYFTGKDRGNSEYLNIAVTLKDVDGEWLIDDLQIARPQNK